MKLHLGHVFLIILGFQVAGPANADWIRINIDELDRVHPAIDAAAGARVCAEVLTAPPAARQAVQRIEALDTTTSANGIVVLNDPGGGLNPLFFEGRIRFIIEAQGYCPVSCDIDFYWSHDPVAGEQSVGEANCDLLLHSSMQEGSSNCRVGTARDYNYVNNRVYYNARGQQLRLDDIDGYYQINTGDTRDRPMNCNGRDPISVPVVPELVPTNPITTRPTLPSGPIDPTRVVPTRP